MQASDLVKELQELIAKHGDLEVIDECNNDPVVEFLHDPGDDPVFVID